MASSPEMEAQPLRRLVEDQEWHNNCFLSRLLLQIFWFSLAFVFYFLITKINILEFFQFPVVKDQNLLRYVNVSVIKDVNINKHWFASRILIPWCSFF